MGRKERLEEAEKNPHIPGTVITDTYGTEWIMGTTGEFKALGSPIITWPQLMDRAPLKVKPPQPEQTTAHRDAEPFPASTVLNVVDTAGHYWTYIGRDRWRMDTDGTSSTTGRVLNSAALMRILMPIGAEWLKENKHRLYPGDLLEEQPTPKQDSMPLNFVKVEEGRVSLKRWNPPEYYSVEQLPDESLVLTPADITIDPPVSAVEKMLTEAMEEQAAPDYPRLSFPSGFRISGLPDRETEVRCSQCTWTTKYVSLGHGFARGRRDAILAARQHKQVAHPPVPADAPRSIATKGDMLIRGVKVTSDRNGPFTTAFRIDGVHQIVYLNIREWTITNEPTEGAEPDYVMLPGFAQSPHHIECTRCGWTYR